MRVDVSIDYPGQGSSAKIWIHDFPAIGKIELLPKEEGRPQRVMIGEVEITIFDLLPTTIEPE
uniref:Uncharacterized protein n=1 Tax=viral metagenome TaxID=1070528 RepID=A0A6M3KD10_9ZZZZ